jgi:hypothetical protein
MTQGANQAELQAPVQTKLLLQFATSPTLADRACRIGCIAISLVFNSISAPTQGLILVYKTVSSLENLSELLLSQKLVLRFAIASLDFSGDSYE